MKENKKRIIFWFIVMVIFISLGLYGRSSFKAGFGKYGATKLILDPIALEFNTSDDIKKLTDIRADVEKGSIVVTYINPSEKKEKYDFEYSNSNGIESITNKDEYGNQMWIFIAKHMADAVYHTNGGKGSIFDLYATEVFTQTNINDGLMLNEASKSITINIKQNVVRNITGKYKTINDDVYAKEDDYTNLVNDLNTNNFFLYTNKDIKVYIKNTTTSYDIYASITENNASRAYKSVANAIKVLKPNVFETLVPNGDSYQFDTNSTTYLYQTEIVFSEANIFNIEDRIFEVSLYK